MNIIIISSKDLYVDIYKTRTLENITAMTGAQFYKDVRDISKAMEGKMPDIIYAEVTSSEIEQIKIICPKSIIVSSSPLADITINGEPEAVFPLLVEALKLKKDLLQVPGITFKVTTDKPKPFNINDIPIINESLALSTKGCKGQCSFCELRINQRYLRFRDIDKTVNEIKEITKKKNHYRFADCSLDSNSPTRLKKLLREIIRLVPGTTFEANFRPDFHKYADNEMWELLIEAGLAIAFIGVEAFNNEDLKLYNKNCTTEDIEKTINEFKSHKVNVDIGFININPFSTRKGIEQNIHFLSKYHFATPEKLFISLGIPGVETPIKCKIRDAGLLRTDTVYQCQDYAIGYISCFWWPYHSTIHKNAYAQFKCLSLNELYKDRREAEYLGRNDIIDVIDKYDIKLQAILNDRSDKMIEWFNKLFDMAKLCHLYDMEDFYIVSNSFLNEKYMKEVNKNFYNTIKDFRKEIVATFTQTL